GTTAATPGRPYWGHYMARFGQRTWDKGFEDCKAHPRLRGLYRVNGMGGGVSMEGDTRLQSAKISLCILGILGACILCQSVSAQTPARGKRTVIGVSRLLDGKGHVLRDTRIVIDGSKIVAIDPKAGPVDYDLRGLTVLPGWIDAHVHITWSF